MNLLLADAWRFNFCWYLMQISGYVFIISSVQVTSEEENIALLNLQKVLSEKVQKYREQYHLTNIVSKKRK